MISFLHKYNSFPKGVNLIFIITEAVIFIIRKIYREIPGCLTGRDGRGLEKQKFPFVTCQTQGPGAEFLNLNIFKKIVYSNGQYL